MRFERNNKARVAITASAFAILFASLFAAALSSLVAPAYSHSVPETLYNKYARIDEETFSGNELLSGDTLDITGIITNSLDVPLEDVTLGYYIEGINSPKFEIIYADPAETFTIAAGEQVDFEMELDVLQSGTGHVHSAVIGKDGNVIVLGRGQTVRAETDQSSDNTVTLNVNGKTIELQTNSQYIISNFKAENNGISFHADVADEYAVGSRGSITIYGVDKALACPCEFIINGRNLGSGSTIGQRTVLQTEDMTYIDNDGAGTLFMHWYNKLPVDVTIIGKSGSVVAAGIITTSDGGKRYVNPSIGLQMDLPGQWNVGAIPGAPFDYVVPPGMDPSAVQPDVAILVYGTLSASDFDTFVTNSASADCKVPSSDVTINGISGVKMEECAINNSIQSIYAFKTADDKRLVIMYFAKSTDLNDQYAKDFEQSVQSIRTIDAGKSNDNLADVQPQSFAVQLKNNVKIDVAVKSNSKVSNFAFDEGKKQVSFKVEGTDETAGSALIPIGKVLKGPYTVYVDGNNYSDFVLYEGDNLIPDVDPHGRPYSEKTSIRINYHHSMHEITVTGTEVVPEFPVSILLMAAAIGISSTLTFLLKRKQL